MKMHLGYLLSALALCLSLFARLSAATNATEAGASARTKDQSRQRQDDQATPISKVIELLKEMTKKGTKNMNEEEKQYYAFYTWCENEFEFTETEIAKGRQQIKVLRGLIAVHTREMDLLQEAIGKLKVDIEQLGNEKTELTNVRTAAANDYAVAVKDTQESITAIDGALKTLKEQDYDRPQATEVLLQDPHLPLEAKAAITDFLQLKRSRQPEAPDAAEPHGYSFQSTTVVEMLERLEEEFEKKLNDMNKAESESKYNYEIMMQQKTELETDTKRQLSRHENLFSEESQANAKAQGELTDAETKLEEDKQHLADTKEMCYQKRLDFKSRQKLREDELKAIAHATEIIESHRVKGAGDKHLPTLLQIRAKRGGTALAQLRNGNNEQSAEQSQLVMKAVAFLDAQAKAQNSQLLNQVVQSAKDGPFSRVLRMIRDLMTKLREESIAEHEDNGYCQAELTTNKQSRDSKTGTIEKLNMKIEELNGEIAQLTQDIAVLTQEVAELRAAQEEATRVRRENRATNTATIDDAHYAQVAINNAKTILTNFYDKAAEATAMVQVKQSASPNEQPEIFDKSYNGLTGEKKGIFDFFEVMLSDFARLQSETEADESIEAATWEKYMKDTDVILAGKASDLKHKSRWKKDAENEKHDSQVEKKSTTEQLDAAMDYYSKLKPKCVDTGISYEERKAAMDAEIASLEESLKILKGTDIA